MPVAPSLFFKFFGYLLWSAGYICEGLFLHVRVWRTRLYYGKVLIVWFNPHSQVVIVNWGYYSCSNLSMSVHPFRLDQYFFQTWGIFRIRFLTAKSQLLPFRLLGVLRPTMLKVLSGYSISENDFFLRDCCLLAEFEFETFDNRLKLML